MPYNFANLNLTELSELARHHGCLSAHRGLGRQTLINLIEGKIDPEEVPKDPADDDRNAMMEMKEEWKDVYNQLKCGSEFYACWDCPAARARACAVMECEPRLMDKVRGR
jgi:hypothetical protein